MKTRVVFFGTPDFAAEFLKGLINDPFFDVVAVVAQPDALLGRKKILTAPPTKVVAEQHGIPVFQPTKLKGAEFQDALKALAPEVGVIIAYGRILPQGVIDLMPQGLINVHPSLLPRWRGPSPVQAAIAAGDAVSGVSIMKIDDQMDHGPLLSQIELPLTAEETPETFFAQVVTQGVPLLIESLKSYLGGGVELQTQDDTQATYCKLLTREDGKIHWQEPAEVILNKLRAYTPWPGVSTESFKVLVAKKTDQQLPAGQLLLEDSRLLVGTGSTALELVEVQPASGKRMLATDWARGQRPLPERLV